MSKFSIITHKNYNVFRGIKLTDLKDRYNFFKGTSNDEVTAEVCSNIQAHVVGTYFKTYEQLANYIIDNFYLSELHKAFLNLPSSNIGSFSSNFGTFQGKNVIFICGVVGTD